MELIIVNEGKKDIMVAHHRIEGMSAIRLVWLEGTWRARDAIPRDQLYSLHNEQSYTLRISAASD